MATGVEHLRVGMHACTPGVRCRRLPKGPMQDARGSGRFGGLSRHGKVQQGGNHEEVGYGAADRGPGGQECCGPHTQQGRPARVALAARRPVEKAMYRGKLHTTARDHGPARR